MIYRIMVLMEEGDGRTFHLHDEKEADRLADLLRDHQEVNFVATSELQRVAPGYFNGLGALLTRLYDKNPDLVEELRDELYSDLPEGSWSGDEVEIEEMLIYKWEHGEIED